MWILGLGFSGHYNRPALISVDIISGVYCIIEIAPIMCSFEVDADYDVSLPSANVDDSFHLHTDYMYFIMAAGKTDSNFFESENNHIESHYDLMHAFKSESHRMSDYNPYYVNIYLGCGENKGCIGYPQGCISNETCEAILSYEGVSDGRYDITIQGQEEDYVAFGFSDDTSMGSDGVIACRGDGIVEKYWNVAKGDVVIQSNPQDGIELISAGYEDGFVNCNFFLDALLSFEQQENFDLNEDYNFILFAKGPVNSTTNEISGHGPDRSNNATNGKVNFGKYNPFRLDAAVYPMCDDEKGCVGFPDGCLSTKDCVMLVTYKGTEY